MLILMFCFRARVSYALHFTSLELLQRTIYSTGCGVSRAQYSVVIACFVAAADRYAGNDDDTIVFGGCGGQIGG